MKLETEYFSLSIENVSRGKSLIIYFLSSFRKAFAVLPNFPLSSASGNIRPISKENLDLNPFDEERKNVFGVAIPSIKDESSSHWAGKITFFLNSTED